MAPERKLANPLALAVLVLLRERPMHPYEMAATLREREKEQSIKLSYGSLYSVIDALGREGLVVERERLREGRRPERTVYDITPAGRAEMEDWLAELLREPHKEYPWFMAGLSLAPALPPDRVAELLDERLDALRLARDAEAVKIAGARRSGVPRLFLVEAEYEQALRGAELAWVEALLEELRAGTLDGLDLWRGFHASADAPDEPPVS